MRKTSTIKHKEQSKYVHRTQRQYETALTRALKMKKIKTTVQHKFKFGNSMLETGHSRRSNNMIRKRIPRINTRRTRYISWTVLHARRTGVVHRLKPPARRKRNKINAETSYRPSTLFLTINHTSSQSQKHSTETSQTQINVIQSQNQQQPIDSCFNIVHNLNVLRFNHKTYQQSPKDSVHVIGLHDVTATVDKSPLCKI